MATNTNPPLDIAIIGSGPAAFTAALYAARENLSVTVFERAQIGGLASTISQVDNFPGFSGTGAQLMQTMRTQAETFGATTEYGECTAIKKTKSHFKLTIDDQPFLARTIIIATGSERRKLGIPGEDQAGVSYCATCDGPLTRGKTVIVIGGGNSAVQESFFLLKYARSVHLINRSPLRASDILQDRLRQEPRITLTLHATPLRFLHADGKLTGLECQLKSRSRSQTFPADAAFIFIGNVPATSFLPSSILAEDGSVITDPSLATSIPGLFAAGDCRQGSIKQVVTAAAEGAIAALSASHYLEK